MNAFPQKIVSSDELLVISGAFLLNAFFQYTVGNLSNLYDSPAFLKIIFANLILFALAAVFSLYLMRRSTRQRSLEPRSAALRYSFILFWIAAISLALLTTVGGTSSSFGLFTVFPLIPSALFLLIMYYPSLILFGLAPSNVPSLGQDISGGKPSRFPGTSALVGALILIPAGLLALAPFGILIAVPLALFALWLIVLPMFRITPGTLVFARASFLVTASLLVLALLSIIFNWVGFTGQ